MKNNTKIYQFENPEERECCDALMCIEPSYKTAKPAAYKKHCRTIAKSTDFGAAHKAFESAIELNPVGLRARLYFISHCIKTGEVLRAIESLNAVYPLITLAQYADALYIAYAELLLKLGCAKEAAVCATYAKYFYSVTDAVDNKVYIERTPNPPDYTNCNIIDLLDLEKELKNIEKPVKIPVITLPELVEKKFVNRLNSMRRHNEFEFIIVNKTGQVINYPPDNCGFYLDEHLVFSFCDEYEARVAIGACCGNRSVASVGQEVYMDICDIGLNFINERKFKQAKEIFETCFKVNPLSLLARLQTVFCCAYMGEFDEGREILNFVYPFIYDRAGAGHFYDMCGVLETLREEYTTAAAAFLYRKNFGSDKSVESALSQLAQDYGVDMDSVNFRYQSILKEAGIPLLTTEEISSRRDRLESGIKL